MSTYELTCEELELEPEAELWGSYSMRAAWAWHDDWIWTPVVFPRLGIAMLVLGPLRFSVTWPIVV